MKSKPKFVINQPVSYRHPAGNIIFGRISSCWYRKSGGILTRIFNRRVWWEYKIRRHDSKASEEWIKEEDITEEKEDELARLEDEWKKKNPSCNHCGNMPVCQFYRDLEYSRDFNTLLHVIKHRSGTNVYATVKRIVAQNCKYFKIT